MPGTDEILVAVTQLGIQMGAVLAQLQDMNGRQRSDHDALTQMCSQVRMNTDRIIKLETHWVTPEDLAEVRRRVDYVDSRDKWASAAIGAATIALFGLKFVP